MVSSNPGDRKLLATGICSPLALNKINLNFLTHISPVEADGSITSLCTEGAAGRATASLVEIHQSRSDTVKLQGDVSIFSIYPHGQQPQVTGGLLHALATKGIALLGLASSPSAISAVVFSGETENAISACFNAFEFPAYRSPSDWYAAYEGKEHLLQKIIASYQEKVIRIYDIVQQSDLDLWSLMVPASWLRELGSAFSALAELKVKMSFVAAVPAPEGRLAFSFCFPRAQAAEIRHGISRQLGNVVLARHEQVAALFIHGPHFGDRYGIANSLASALENGGVSLLAVGCTVSSISVIIPKEDLATAVEALERTFQKSRT